MTFALIRRAWAGALLCTAALMPAVSWASAGVVTHLNGVLKVARGKTEPKPLALQAEVETGDVLIAEDKTFARVRLNDGSNLVLRPNSQVEIQAFQYKPDAPQEDKVDINLVKGGLRVVTGAVGKRNPERFEARTVSATAGIRGTDFSLQFCQGDCQGLTQGNGQPLPDGLHANVIDGQIFLANEAGMVEVPKGDFAFVKSLASLPIKVPAALGYLMELPRWLGLPASVAASAAAGAVQAAGVAVDLAGAAASAVAGALSGDGQAASTPSPGPTTTASAAASSSPTREGQTGYVAGSPQGALGGRSSVTVNNAKGSSDIIGRLYLNGQRPAVREMWVKAGESFRAESLLPGRYIFRYRPVGSDSTFEADRPVNLSESVTEQSIRSSHVTVNIFSGVGGNLSYKSVTPANF